MSVFAALALSVIAVIVSMPLPASAGSYESCLGSCAIGSNRDSPMCIDRSAECLRPSGPGSTPRRDLYGAIAYSWTLHSAGISSEYGTQAEADKVATKYCKDMDGAADCEIRFRFQNTCGALAESGAADIIGWGWDNNKNIAQQKSIADCEKFGGKECKALISDCSR
jgi:hypothetical protein